MWQVRDLLESSSDKLWVSAERQECFRGRQPGWLLHLQDTVFQVLFRSMEYPELVGTHRDHGTQLQKSHSVPVQYMALAREIISSLLMMPKLQPDIF